MEIEYDKKELDKWAKESMEILSNNGYINSKGKLFWKIFAFVSLCTTIGIIIYLGMLIESGNFQSQLGFSCTEVNITIPSCPSSPICPKCPNQICEPDINITINPVNIIEVQSEI